MTGYDIDSPGFEFGEGTEIFLLTSVKRPECEAGHLPYLVTRLRMSESRPPLPSRGFMAYGGTNLYFMYLVCLDRGCLGQKYWAAVMT